MDLKPIEKFNLFRAVVEHFVELSGDEWEILRNHLKLVQLKKKDFYVQAGDVCDSIALIVSGSARYFHVKDGIEITNYFSVENEFLTSYKSFLTRQASIINIEVLENTELIILSYNSLQNLLNNSLMAYKMERFGRLIAEFTICCYDDRITSFIIQSAEERYLDLFTKSPNIIKRIPQHYIANYLGITPVSLSRIRRRIMDPAKELHQAFT